MASLPHSLGLRAAATSSLSNSTPNYAPYYCMFHFLFAYGILSSRTLKQYYGIDHNVSPREDLAKYGAEAVREGKLTQRKLNMLKRNESAHANAVENFPLFVAATLFANQAGVPNHVVNTAALTYTVARCCYAVIYILVDSPAWSQMRGITWWAGNVSCLYLLWKSGKAMNA